MMGLRLTKGRSEPLQVLCLGAHSDDIEIGCGGTLLQLARYYDNIVFSWVVFSAVGIRAKEAAKGAELFTAGSKKNMILRDFRDGFLPYTGGSVKEVFEELKGQGQPDLIFTHWQGDAHQDHRLISELTWNTFRNQLILEYEIPKYDGDMGRPNTFVPLDSPLHEQKVNHLFEVFESQRCKPWFDRASFLGLMRLRGMESNSAGGYAEAFYTRKVILHGEQ
jgi:LmbE family N-acetylglucosaminyl deacetylase